MAPGVSCASGVAAATFWLHLNTRPLQRCTADFTELASVDLAADFETDDEKEDCHQAVVDPEMEIAFENEGSQSCPNEEVP